MQWEDMFTDQQNRCRINVLAYLEGSELKCFCSLDLQEFESFKETLKQKGCKITEEFWNYIRNI